MVDTLARVVRETKRPAYVNGIRFTEAGKRVIEPLELADPEQWYTLPPTAIVVLDEAQRVFRPRARGASVPKHFAEFETHRHGGIDVYLLTQDPMLIDSHVRKLAGKHVHLKRTFGMSVAKVSTWRERVAKDVDKKAEYADAQDERWVFPKQAYEWYESAEVHTHKRELPRRQLVWIGGLSCGVAVAIWYIVSWGFTTRENSSKPGSSSAVVEPGEAKRGDRNGNGGRTGGRVGGGVRGGGFLSGVARSAWENPWAAEVRAARVVGHPETAPFYDALQKAVAQPVVAGCLTLGPQFDCVCHSAQGSRVTIDAHECRRLLRDGWFDATKPADSAKKENVAYLQAKDTAAQQVMMQQAPVGKVGGVVPPEDAGPRDSAREGAQ
jgi:zona occludens toxin